MKVEKPFEGKRFDLMGLNDRSQYVIVDTGGIMVTFPDNKRENLNYQSTATALARMISIAIGANVSIKVITKQLEESSMQIGDTPDIILTAIKKYIDCHQNLEGIWRIDEDK